MAWHHHLTKHARRHGGSFVHKHPMIAAALGIVGIVALGEVALGKHATPSPATQNKTGGA